MNLQSKIIRDFNIASLTGPPKRKTALLINPPIYDTQHWAEWSQPYGLLRIGTLLKKYHYKRVELFDFLETYGKKQIPNHRINPEENYWETNHPAPPVKPIVISKGKDSIEVYKKHFGKSWKEFENWLKDQEFDANHPPSEVWISAIMTYWWESVRDLTMRLKRLFGQKTTIILGGIYSTLAPEHAACMTSADIVVAGEIDEANELWTDLSFYSKPPTYAIITPSRGCSFNCSYCAQKTINSGVQKVRHRLPTNIVAEIKSKYEIRGGQQPHRHRGVGAGADDKVSGAIFPLA
ncbi:MAG: hypothetical protein HYY20_05275 [Candidatus Tectomicrobia bacterium]|uniref:B12-binding domain-containing protein n=1 Tax=Tectimicrobiota bacterium TaxID=2528274 RepID=A0A932CNA8_UNCTE|nr:hypothetical protein [Candidatus Tectomicrobia bacterium]